MKTHLAPYARSAPAPSDADLLLDDIPLLTMEEMALTIHPVVYGFCGRDRRIFYVGQTVDPRNRFPRYTGRVKNTHLLRRMRDCGSDLMVAILSRPRPGDLRAIEKKMIEVFAPDLANQVGNHFKSTGNCRGAVMSTDVLGICAACDQPRDKTGKFCGDCIGILVRGRAFS